MPENTSKRDPFVHLLGMLSDGQSDYITGMEADGQRQLVASEQMPTDAPTEQLEALGFTFGPPDEHDPMFRPATLPEGWTRQGSDHAMWSYILDEQGRKRVSIFYKAAFYDRSAHANVVSPAAPLGDLLYEDDEPTSVVLDDLLTAGVARAWLDSTEEGVNEHCAICYPDGNLPDRQRNKLARIARIRELVEQAAST